MPAIEFRQEYTANCPACGRDARFTTIGVITRAEKQQVALGLVPADCSVLRPKRVARVEVACITCDG